MGVAKAPGADTLPALADHEGAVGKVMANRTLKQAQTHRQHTHTHTHGERGTRGRRKKKKKTRKHTPSRRWRTTRLVSAGTHARKRGGLAGVAKAPGAHILGAGGPSQGAVCKEMARANSSDDFHM